MPFQLQCLNVVIFVFILFGTVCVSWTWIFLSFPMLGKFSAIMSSNMVSNPFLLSSPSGTSILWLSVSLMLSQCSLKLSSLKTFFLSHSLSLFFSVQVEWFLLLSLLFCWSTPLYHLIYYWSLLVYLKFQLLYNWTDWFFSSAWFFFRFSNSLFLYRSTLCDICCNNFFLSYCLCFDLLMRDFWDTNFKKLYFTYHNLFINLFF